MHTAVPRTLFRAIHLLGAAALGTFAYSPWRDVPLFLDAVRWLLFPALAASGLWLWLGARWLARRRHAAAAGARPAARAGTRAGTPH